MTDTKTEDPKGIDILGIIERCDDDRVLVLPGELRAGRRGDKKVIAVTKCELSFEKEEDIQTCIEQLKASDAEMAKRPDSQQKYDWICVWRRGMTLDFGVAWYDKEFFDQRKDAYKSATHEELFKKFGAKPTDFKIEHQVIE